MNTFNDLNGLSNSLIEYTDQRPSKVLFNTSVFIDRQITISSTSITVEPTYEITEIINYSTANCRYRISIISNNPTFVANSYIQWTSLPSGITSSGSGGVYTLTGLKTKFDWEAVKNATWVLPSNYATYSSFWIRVAVVYYDEELSTTVEKEIDIYDPIYYPITQFELTSTVSVHPSYVYGPTIDLIPQTFVFCEATAFFSTKLVAVASLSCDAKPIQGLRSFVTASTAISITGTVIPAQLVVRRKITTGAFTSSVYNIGTGNFTGDVDIDYYRPQTSGPTRLRWAKTDLIGGGPRITNPQTQSTDVITFYRKLPNTIDYQGIYVLEAFDFTIPPATERNSYQVKDFKIRNDGGAVIIGGNPRAGAEIWTISGNTFTRQVNTYNSVLQANVWVTLHPNGQWAAQTGIINSDYTQALTFLRFNGTSWGRRGISFVPTSSNVTSIDSTYDIDWDPSGNYFALCVGNQTRIFYFQIDGTGTNATCTLLHTINMNGSGKIIWNSTGEYLAVFTYNRVYMRRLSGTGTGTSFVNAYWNGSYSELSLGSEIKDADWKFDSSVLTIAGSFGLQNYTKTGNLLYGPYTTNITTDMPTISWRKQ